MRGVLTRRGEHKLPRTHRHRGLSQPTAAEAACLSPSCCSACTAILLCFRGPSACKMAAPDMSDGDSSPSNTLPIGHSHGHFFVKKNFHRPTYCHHCTDLLWGLIGQGYVCEGKYTGAKGPLGPRPLPAPHYGEPPGVGTSLCPSLLRFPQLRSS